MIKVALIGNPNVGKTTLFNLLTGSSQYVGNWPGVTVEKKSGYSDGMEIVDLPGIYALDTFSNEEKVSKDFLEQGIPNVIVNIVDASNLERNLYLTSQINKYGIPIVIALNMIDIADKKGIVIDAAALQAETGITTVPIVAAKGKGIRELTEIIKSGNYRKTNSLRSFENEKEAYGEISSIIMKASSKTEGIVTMTRAIDNVVLNPFLAYPLFFGMMFLIFKLTFSWVGDPLAGMFEEFLLVPFMDLVSNLLSGSSDWFRSLIVDGIIGGVGSIVVFLPVILTLFFGITILEDSGYMARAALMMDRLMRKIGLSGKAFIPMIIGFGCTVPAVMATRSLESEKDRKLTALLTPFMSCNAKLPVFVLFTSVFFSGNQDVVVFSLYFLGVLVSFALGLIFKRTIFKKDEEPFIIELPEYKLPSLKHVAKNTWDKGEHFLRKAATVIFGMSVIIWFLSNFNLSGQTDMGTSFLASIGGAISPIFAPLGFGNWQASVALITGIMAKEVVVSTMGVIYGGTLSSVLPSAFTTATALSFLVFVLLYTPCISALATMKKEFGGRFALFAAANTFAVAWIVSFAVKLAAQAL